MPRALSLILFRGPTRRQKPLWSLNHRISAAAFAKVCGQKRALSVAVPSFSASPKKTTKKKKDERKPPVLVLDPPPIPLPCPSLPARTLTCTRAARTHSARQDSQPNSPLLRFCICITLPRFRCSVFCLRPSRYRLMALLWPHSPPACSRVLAVAASPNGHYERLVLSTCSCTCTGTRTAAHCTWLHCNGPLLCFRHPGKGACCHSTTPLPC